MLASAGDAGPTFNQRRVGVSVCNNDTLAQTDTQTLLSIEQLLASAGDSGPALNRHWFSAVLTCGGLRRLLARNCDEHRVKAKLRHTKLL